MIKIENLGGEKKQLLVQFGKFFFAIKYHHEEKIK